MGSKQLMKPRPITGFWADGWREYGWPAGVERQRRADVWMVEPAMTMA